MIPHTKFTEILQTNKAQMNSDYDELIMASQLMADRPHYFTMDDNGMFHCQASGPLDDCIRALSAHLAKLEKIKAFKEGRR